MEVGVGGQYQQVGAVETKCSPSTKLKERKCSEISGNRTDKKYVLSLIHLCYLSSIVAAIDCLLY